MNFPISGELESNLVTGIKNNYFTGKSQPSLCIDGIDIKSRLLHNRWKGSVCMWQSPGCNTFHMSACSCKGLHQWNIVTTCENTIMWSHFQGLLKTLLTDLIHTVEVWWENTPGRLLPGSIFSKTQCNWLNLARKFTLIEIEICYCTIPSQP